MDGFVLSSGANTGLLERARGRLERAKRLSEDEGLRRESAL
jgi:hypothetical protein